MISMISISCFNHMVFLTITSLQLQNPTPFLGGFSYLGTFTLPIPIDPEALRQGPNFHARSRPKSMDPPAGSRKGGYLCLTKTYVLGLYPLPTTNTSRNTYIIYNYIIYNRYISYIKKYIYTHVNIIKLDRDPLGPRMLARGK